jgi:Flp pilus assembly protein TadB
VTPPVAPVPVAVAVLVAVLTTSAAVALAVPRSRTLPAPRGDPAGRPEREPFPVLRVTATVAVGSGAAFFVGGPVGAAAAAGLAALCWWLTGRMEPPAVRRRRERLAASVPHAVDLMAACLTVGLSPGAALEQIAAAVDDPLGEELRAVVGRLRLGVDPATVWRDLAAHPQLGGLGRTVSRAVDSGASVADAMQRLADDLRRGHRAAMETRARAVGVRAALPLGVCLLPAFVLVGVVPLVAGSVSVLVRP